MSTFLFVFGLMLLVVAGMAVGAIFANKPLKGSCGGLNKLGLKKDCPVCGGDDDECKKEQERKAGENTDLAYDATKKDR
ncbi:(Na+)-NQR maturation NqrM [Biformimicrobium ophioploci]|uniref:(Na+)-NQR maturation NqrM n=1 Tax=Biformimicrobium ophioploci TaxID=3036711 RepID=A0ABQ6M1E8_9GAMM|nr:(Na+)-NQR maturation NqrM [Microbulbifer sp. NKW57]GMG88180.1 (Na+)-NQR maturation NqrM [Microbulbifer sp. NKW57]